MVAYIALGGLLGTLARYGLQGWIQDRFARGSFPLGTLVVNVIGSLALGFLMRYTTGSLVVTPAVRAGLTIGFCGAFTTMSAFAYEGQALFADGSYLQGWLYLGGTVLACLLATIAGIVLADQLL